MYYLLVQSGSRSRAPLRGTENSHIAGHRTENRIHFTDNLIDDLGRVNCQCEKTEEKTEQMSNVKYVQLQVAQIGKNELMYFHVKFYVKNEMPQSCLYH